MATAQRVLRDATIVRHEPWMDEWAESRGCASPRDLWKKIVRGEKAAYCAMKRSETAFAPKGASQIIPSRARQRNDSAYRASKIRNPPTQKDRHDPGSFSETFSLRRQLH